MTDLHNIIFMLAKSDETFEKSKSGDGWKVIVTGRGIAFHFNQDGSFYFICKD